MPAPAVLGLVAALAAPGLATQVSMREAPCPIDATDTVRIYERMTANTHGGFDSDLAAYSSRGQFREYAVATCQRTLFSLYGSDMDTPLTAEQLPGLRTALAEEVARLADTDAPEVWERYRIAARMYRELGRDELFIGELYLRASWTARDHAVGVYLGLEGPKGARELIDAGRGELAGDLALAQRKTVLYNLARVAHRGGFNAERDEFLDAFEAAGTLTPAERAAVDRFRRVAHDIEPTYQDLAIQAFERGLRAEGLTDDVRLRSTYLLADLYRRRGKEREAVGQYALVLLDEQAPLNLRELALLLSKELVE